METININKLKSLKKTPKDIFLSTGHKIIESNQALTPEIAEVLIECGVDKVFAIDFDEQESFIFNAKNKAISINSPILLKEGQLQKSLYDDQGNCVLTAGETWTNELARQLKGAQVKTLYLKKPPQQINESEAKAEALRHRIKKILPKKNKRYKAADYKKAAETIIKSLNDEYETASKSMFTSDGLDALSVRMGTDVIPDEKNALKNYIAKINPTQTRSEESKTYLRNFYNRGVTQLGGLINSLLNQNQNKDFNHNLIGFAKELISVFIKDKDLLLHAHQLNQENKVDENFVLRQNLNRGIFTVHIATELGYSAQQIYEMTFGAFLHDIGMMMVPRQILLKPGALDETEKAEIFKHPINSLNMLQKLSHVPLSTPLIAYQCHERCDRSGYPRRKSHKIISKYARIVMVADTYCALTSPRPHRKAFTPDKAMEFIAQEAHKGRLDKEICNAFVKINTLYPVGTWVVLSNDHIGKVVGVYRGKLKKPVIRTFFKGKEVQKNPGTIDLSKTDDIEIVKTFDGNGMGVDVLAGI